MASRIQAVAAYRPRIRRARTNDTGVVVARIVGRTGLNRGEVINVLTELNDTILEYNRQAIFTTIEGFGTFWPSINLDGNIVVNLRKGGDFLHALNTPGYFIGDIENRENIGRPPGELVKMWNNDHPDDPVTD